MMYMEEFIWILLLSFEDFVSAFYVTTQGITLVLPFFNLELLFLLFFCLALQLNFHSLFLQEVLMRIHFFTAVFPAINQWFEKVVETVDEFSTIYIFVAFLIQSSIMFLISFFIVKNERKYLEITF